MEDLDDATTWLWQRGRLYRRAGVLPRAELLLLLARQRAPHSVAILRALARVFLDTDQTLRCLGCLDALAVLTAPRPQDIRMRSGCLFRLGRTDEALRQLEILTNKEGGTCWPD
jgi:hypothetical protein